MPRNGASDRKNASNNNHQHHQLEQSAHNNSAPSNMTSMSKSNKTTANGNHKNLVNSVETSDATITCSSDSKKKNCAASEIFLSKDVKID